MNENFIIEFLRNFIKEQKPEYGMGTYTAPWLETLNLWFNEVWWLTAIMLLVILVYLFNDFFHTRRKKKNN